jgi:single-strand DNA-binding protein
MHASIHGRAAFDPKETWSKNGKAMTVVRLAVNVTGRNATEEETLWLDVLGFGEQATELARVRKGESVSAIGPLTKGRYTTPTGEERESWSMIAEAIVTARSARPGQHRKAPAPAPAPKQRGDLLAFQRP